MNGIFSTDYTLYPIPYTLYPKHMFNKLKQIKDLRSKAKQMQSTLAEESVEASAAWGKVKLTMNGNQEITSIDIDPELLSPDKKAELEKAVQEAVADAIKKVQRVMAKKMQDMGGLPEFK